MFPLLNFPPPPLSLHPHSPPLSLRPRSHTKMSTNYVPGYTPPEGLLADSTIPLTKLVICEEVDPTALPVPEGRPVVYINNPLSPLNTLRIIVCASNSKASAAGAAGAPRCVVAIGKDYDEAVLAASANAAPGARDVKVVQPKPAVFTLPPCFAAKSSIGPAGNLPLEPALASVFTRKVITPEQAKYTMVMSGKPWNHALAQQAEELKQKRDPVDNTIGSIVLSDHTDSFARALVRAQELEYWLVFAMVVAYTRAGSDTTLAQQFARVITNYARTLENLEDDASDARIKKALWWVSPPRLARITSATLHALKANAQALLEPVRGSASVSLIGNTLVHPLMIRCAVDELRANTQQYHGLVMPPSDFNPVASMVLQRKLFQKCKSPTEYQAALARTRQRIEPAIKAAERAHGTDVSQQMRREYDAVLKALDDEQFYYFEPPSCFCVKRIDGRAHLVPSPPPEPMSVVVASFNINPSSVSGRVDLQPQATRVVVLHKRASIDPAFIPERNSVPTQRPITCSDDIAALESIPVTGDEGYEEEGSQVGSKRSHLHDSSTLEEGEPAQKRSIAPVVPKEEFEHVHFEIPSADN